MNRLVSEEAWKFDIYMEAVALKLGRENLQRVSRDSALRASSPPVTTALKSSSQLFITSVPKLTAPLHHMAQCWITSWRPWKQVDVREGMDREYTVEVSKKEVFRPK